MMIVSLRRVVLARRRRAAISPKQVEVSHKDFPLGIVFRRPELSYTRQSGHTLHRVTPSWTVSPVSKFVLVLSLVSNIPCPAALKTPTAAPVTTILPALRAQLALAPSTESFSNGTLPGAYLTWCTTRIGLTFRSIHPDTRRATTPVATIPLTLAHGQGLSVNLCRLCIGQRFQLRALWSVARARCCKHVA